MRSALAALGAFVALAAPGALAAEPGNEEVRPAIWRLADADTTIYLLGTSHVLPPGFVWRSAGVDRVIAAADELVLETADDQYEKPAWMYRAMALDPPSPILDRIGRDHRRRLEAVLKGSGMPVAQFDRLQTWAVAFMLMGMSYWEWADIGDTGKPRPGPSGVEIELTAIFRAARKPVSGIETTPEQLGFFGNLSEAGQRDFLEDMVDDMTEQGARGAAAETPIENDWVTGDVAGVGAECDAEESFSPELREILLRRRNIAWTQWLIDRLDRPGTLLFAVGACHLAGADSVQTMLSARGFEAARID